MALTDALKAALAVDGIPVGVGGRPAGTEDGAGNRKPFIVIWPDSPVRSAITMKANDGQQTTLVCHCYGLSDEAAGIAEQKLADAVYGLYRTVVDGRLVQYPHQLVALPLTRDDHVSPPLYDHVVEWRIPTTPA